MRLNKFKIEVYQRNTWLLNTLKTQFVYGQREILLDFIGYSHDCLIGGLLQHGVLEFGVNIIDSEIPRIKTQRSSLVKRFPLYVYSKTTASDFNQNSSIKSHFIGAPWIYIQDYHSESRLNTVCSPNCKNTIIFPSHQTLGGDSILSVKEIRSKIAYWREVASDNICICLFWVEYLDSNWHEACLLDDVKINCAGVGETFPFWGKSSHRLNYLPKLKQIIESHSTVISEDVSSVIFYAIDSGKNVGVFPDTRSHQKSKSMRTPIAQDLWLKTNMPRLINNICYSELYHSIASSYLGRDVILTRDEMIETLVIFPKVLMDN